MRVPRKSKMVRLYHNMSQYEGILTAALLHREVAALFDAGRSIALLRPYRGSTAVRRNFDRRSAVPRGRRLIRRRAADRHVEA